MTAVALTHVRSWCIMRTMNTALRPTICGKLPTPTAPYSASCPLDFGHQGPCAVPKHEPKKAGT